MKIFMNIIQVITIIVLSMLIYIVVDYKIDIWSSGMWHFKKSFLKEHDPALIREVFKEELKENYTGDIEKDFDSFLISLIMEEINKKEAENLRIYNAFVSEEEMSTYQESGLQEVREIYGESLNENIYYIHITKFHTKESFKNLQKYIPEMKSHENIIVDLRNNTGGYFDSLREISDLFLRENEFVYAHIKKNGQVIEEYYSKGERELNFSNTVILTNENTASVSELFILILKNHLDNVYVIGTPTRGKGVVWSISRFKDGSGYRFISDIMVGPEGSQIPEGGIIPDIIIEDEEKQLMEAVDYINSLITQENRLPVSLSLCIVPLC